MSASGTEKPLPVKQKQEINYPLKFHFAIWMFRPKKKKKVMHGHATKSLKKL